MVEKTSAPIDFVATGLIGEIKIDERELHGRLDAPVTQRIGATSWTVWLNGFEFGGDGEVKARLIRDPDDNRKHMIERDQRVSLRRPIFARIFREERASIFSTIICERV